MCLKPNRTLLALLALPFLLLPCNEAQAAQHPLVKDLDFQRFKDNIETLADFGDRLSGTLGNENSVDWLDAELQAMGYTPERMTVTTGSGTAENIWVTKIGTTSPDKMYIVSAHIDGLGGGGAADDDASGVSLVLELARVVAPADVTTDISIRFVLWNYEEQGCGGSALYAEERVDLQGIEDPPGSGLYPEPTWLGMIQHDMILFDHGLPPGPDQIPEADIDIEYQASAPFAAESLVLAQQLLAGNVAHSTDYPAEIGDNMCCTDSRIFDNYTAAVSVRENRRIGEIGAGSNPHWHRSTDVFENFSEADFRLGFNAAQMTLGTLTQLLSIEVGLFSDSFETGDTTSWSSSLGLAIPEAPRGQLLAGDR